MLHTLLIWGLCGLIGWFGPRALARLDTESPLHVWTAIFVTVSLALATSALT